MGCLGGGQRPVPDVRRAHTLPAAPRDAAVGTADAAAATAAMGAAVSAAARGTAAVSAAAKGTATAAATGAGVSTHRTLSASCCGGALTTRARAHTHARARTRTSTRIRASYHATVCIHSSSERCAFQGGCPARVSGRSCSSRRGRHRSTGAGPRRDGPNANVRVSDRHQAGPRQAGGRRRVPPGAATASGGASQRTASSATALPGTASRRGSGSSTRAATCGTRSTGTRTRGAAACGTALGRLGSSRACQVPMQVPRVVHPRHLSMTRHLVTSDNSELR